MEDPKTPQSSTENSCEIEARFADLCKNQLSLDENTSSQAMKIFLYSKTTIVTNISAIGSSTPDEVARSWFAFILYSVKRLSRSTPEAASETDQNRISLCHILRTVKLNLVDFFKELPQFIVKVGPILSNMYGADWEKRLEAKELQANFLHLSLLSKYYKREYEVFFKTNKDDMAKDSSCDQRSANYHKFGWLLFLALRVHAFSRFKDLVTCTNGLVSILAILIIHVPTCFRNFTFEDLPCFVKKTDRGVNLLGSLCGKYETSEDEVKKMMDKVNDLIVEILKKKCSPASETKSACLFNIDPDGLSYFEDLLEDSTLTSAINLLEKDYDDAVWNKGDIDEKVFVNEDDSLIGSGTLSGGAVSMTGTKRKLDMMASPIKTETSPLSPYKSPKSNANGGNCGSSSKMAATPVSTAMTTAKWLRTFISPLPSKPSAELEKFFVSCDKDITNDIVRRAQIILEAIFPTSSLGERCISGCLQNTNLMDNIWAQQRKMEALKLYYRVLEAMCIAESRLLHGSNLTSLLNNERFHRCMLACSAELVLATHKTATMLFPAVLEKTGITAFDLSKVIESFIRHEESLPRELRRHLNSLEERLLESMVWEKGTSMYNSLIVARPRLSAEINRLGLLAEPMPSLDAIAMLTNASCGGLPALAAAQKSDLPGPCADIRSPKRLCNEYRSVLVERNTFTSPVKDRLMTYNNLKAKMTPPPLQSAFASPTRPSPGGAGETCAETGINIFFSKISKLAAVRINGMVEKLQLSQDYRETVYRLFQQILNQQTSLFFNHHIDQIILCCFYGIAKISKSSLTFKEIIFNYRRLPHCKPQVFRSVFIDWSLAPRRNGRQRTGQDHVDVITFYNEIFVPTVKPLLVELGPMAATTNSSKTHEASIANDAPCPGSPKVSSFPNLPDMSPKKVSMTHNVYVSPLRSSKKDALISHSSKSYYACLGESTHAYQSPSKDLNAINDRLNGSARKIRGARALTFDDAPAPGQVGLVSDSLVAKSLCLPQGVGGVASSSCLEAKTEQQDL